MTPPPVATPKPALPKAPQLRVPTPARVRTAPRSPKPAPSKVPQPPQPVVTRKTALKTAAFATLVAKIAAIKLVDAALVGSSVATAFGSVVFAGAMLMQGDHAPSVNGVEYLAIFAQPKGVARSPQDGHSPQVVASAGIDFTPLGAIAPAGSNEKGGYELVSAQSTLAWVRAGSRILAVKPGDELPGLGTVRTIAWDSGRWTLLGDNGAPLLRSGGPSTAGRNGAPPPFSRQLIFGPQN